VRAPDFLIAGGHKCATTTLYSYFDAHPATAMSRVKEPHFLARGFLRDRLHSGVWAPDEYESLWAGGEPGQLRGEASALYLYFADEVVRRLQPRAERQTKVLLSLRNPVDRAFSSYSDERLKNPQETARGFPDAVEREMRRGPRVLTGVDSPAVHHLALGFYAKGVETFQRALGTQNVRVILFEDLKRDPKGTWHDIENFLGVPHVPEVTTRPARNTGGVQWSSPWTAGVARSKAVVRARRLVGTYSPALHAVLRSLALGRLTKPVEQMDAGTRAELVECYASEVNRLETLLGRRLDLWTNQ